MKKILFLTGTRADFGKLKSLITKVEKSESFEAGIFVTGMHMITKYGMTSKEVEKNGFSNIYKYINQNGYDSMDIILSKTIHGLSDYVKEFSPDLIIVHGDRVEALAGAIVGSMNNILVAHIEGGEVSGTIDELIRHAVSKMSHLHFVANDSAKIRLKQLGESDSNIFVIGSPDLDAMNSKHLPSINYVKERYEIPYSNYGIFLYHPVTTEVNSIESKIKESVSAILRTDKNFIVIYPNNDLGSEVIINELNRLNNNKRFKIFPSIRFECFLTLIKNSDFVVGNSSAGVREVPFYGKPTINLGTRQNNRSSASSIINVEESENQIVRAIEQFSNNHYTPVQEFGNGKSDELFIEIISKNYFWETSKQKVFMDL